MHEGEVLQKNSQKPFGLREKYRKLQRNFESNDCFRKKTRQNLPVT
jgi:hypothetical protein